MAAEGQRDDGVRELAAAASAGDAPAIDALLVRYLPRLRAFVRVRSNDLVRQQESCSDLVQSVCREALEHAGTFDWRGEGPFRAWLFRTALHKILERTRRITQQKRDVRREMRVDGGDGAATGGGPPAGAGGALGDPGPFADPGPTASQFAMANELRAKMERAFDLLADDHREVIALSRIAGLSHAEIAAEMGRSEGAVRMLLSRALVAYVEAMEKS